MVIKKSSKDYRSVDGRLVPSDQVSELIIPDEAVYYIVTHYLYGKNREGLPIVTGISTGDVETVLKLFVEWCGKNEYIKDGILTIGGHKIG